MKNLLHFVLILSCSFLFSCSKDEEVEPKEENTTIDIPSQGCTDKFSFNYGETIADSCLDMHGCFGYLEGMANSGTVGNTLYNDVYDKLIEEEGSLLKEFFQEIQEVELKILYEPSPEHANCYASSDGTILIGYHFAWGTAENYGGLGVAGIMAHEFGHQVQFDLGWVYEHNHYQELEADAWAGLYMTLYKQSDWQYIDNFYRKLYDWGDYLYNDPKHHGTPEQRRAAARFGVDVALAVMETQSLLTYDELHELFMDEISNSIAPRSSGFVKYEDIQYPSLTLEQRKALFPRKHR